MFNIKTNKWEGKIGFILICAMHKEMRVATSEKEIGKSWILSYVVHQ